MNDNGILVYEEHKIFYKNNSKYLTLDQCSNLDYEYEQFILRVVFRKLLLGLEVFILSLPSLVYIMLYSQ
ncbi:uncharacterised protein [Saccharolobus solfataricus]|uniref:Uncharacterized protein n=2 Tax=Saccharolobus solfataricus TaxID=2287 RepID=A0A157SXX8_SACSO|nr:uncharacterised protein [Saccharolobus solfataricus]